MDANGRAEMEDGGSDVAGQGREGISYMDSNTFYSMKISQISRTKFLFNSSTAGRRQRTKREKDGLRFDKLSKRALNVELIKI